jgi:hypothetical protein
MINMILTDKNEQSIYIQCDCGCQGVHLTKYECDGEPKEYILSFSVSAFYAHQGWFNNFKSKMKMILYILKNGTHRYFEVCLPVKEFNELKELISKYE